MITVRVVCIAAALLLFGIESAAESTPLLTSDNISRFLESMKDVQKLGEKYAGDKEAGGAGISDVRAKYASMAASVATQGPSKAQLERAAAPLSSSLSEMRKSDGYGEMLATVKRHGFSNVEEWAAVGDRAILAFAAARMDTEMPKIDDQMKDMRANLAKSGMPAAQQEAMLKMMESSASVIKAFDDVPAADKKAVVPFLSQFEQFGKP